MLFYTRFLFPDYGFAFKENGHSLLTVTAHMIIWYSQTKPKYTRAGVRGGKRGGKQMKTKYSGRVDYLPPNCVNTLSIAVICQIWVPLSSCFDKIPGSCGFRFAECTGTSIYITTWIPTGASAYMSVAKNLRIDSYFKAKGCILCDRLNLIQWTYDACENRTWKLLLFE